MKNLILLLVLISTTVQAGELECIKEEIMRENAKEIIAVTISNPASSGVYAVSYSICFEEMSGEGFCDEETYGDSLRVNKELVEIYRLDDLRIVNYLDRKVSVYRDGKLIADDLICTEKYRDPYANAPGDGDGEPE